LTWIFNIVILDTLEKHGFRLNLTEKISEQMLCPVLS